MKTKQITLLYLLLFSSSCFAELDWIKCPNVPTTNDLYDICFFNRDTGIIIGQWGTILRTIDGGENWNLINNNELSYLHAAAVCGEQRGIIVGDNGTILITNDAGLTWIAETSGVYGNLYSVWMIDSNRGYTVGDYARVFYTCDAGKTWTKKTTPYQGSNEIYVGVVFPDARTGFIASYSGKYLVTEDSGNTWTTKEILPPLNNLCTSSRYNWPCRSYDISMLFYLKPKILFLVGCIDELTGDQYGPTPKTALIYGSGDMGQTWNDELSSIDSSSNYGRRISDVFISQSGYGIAIGNFNLRYVTNDSGKTWKKLNAQDSASNYWLNSLFLFDSTLGFSAGDSGCVFKLQEINLLVKPRQNNIKDNQENIYAQIFRNATRCGIRIKFTLNASKHIRIDLLDLLGRNRATITDGWYQPGQHTILFSKNQVIKGCYIIKTNFSMTRSKILVSF
ncbi:MAG: YCF48-related protein [Chitinivibrionales bacterium]|nr:YCF48-related protein [Chitinivibrionales bacterium]